MKATASAVGLAMLLTGLFLPSAMGDNEVVNGYITLAFLILIPSSLVILAACGVTAGIDALAERVAYAGHKRRMREIRRAGAAQFMAGVERRERESDERRERMRREIDAQMAGIEGREAAR